MSISPAVGACRTLIVEDDRLSSAALRALLTSVGHVVVCAPTVAQGLRELAAFRPQCVILDMMLPDGSGVTLLRHVRQSALPIKIAVATAGNDERTVAEVQALGADLVMRKPIDVGKLTEWMSTFATSTPTDAKATTAR